MKGNRTVPSKFRFRLTCATRLPGLFRIDSADTSIDLPDGRKLYIVAREGATLASSKKLHFEAGGYESEQVAKEAGNHLRLRLQLLNAALALGVNIPSEDTRSSSLAQSIKDDAQRKLGIEVMDNIWGLLVFPDDGLHAEFFMHGEMDVSPSDSLYWLEGLAPLWTSAIELDERSEDALGLLGLASLEASPRNAFLVTYLAVERLLPTEPRHPVALELLERLKKWVTKAAMRKRRALDEKDRDSLLGSLDRLKHESFGNAFLRFGRDNQGREVEATPIVDFIKMCVRTRHRTAHPSKADGSVDYAKLAKGLRTIAMGVLWAKHGIPDLTVAVPASKLSLSVLEKHAFVYEQR